MKPYVLPYDSILPHFESQPLSFGFACSVVGKVSVGARAILAADTVIRADGQVVRIGDDFYLGELSTVHIAHETYAAIVGNGVTVGRNSVVHACTVGDLCVIEGDVVILDGSVVEAGVVIEAGSIVFPRAQLLAGHLYAGSPAKMLRPLNPGERLERETRLRVPTEAPISVNDDTNFSDADEVFVARTARLRGLVTVQAGASIFFSCQLEAGNSSILIGERTNVQDNTHIRCGQGAVSVGADTTVGHNVVLDSCRVGARALVGIGSVISPGTVIDDDVLLAAGSTTNHGQHLERGWMWGGRPARQLSPMTDARRSMLASSIQTYCEYADAYRLAQQSLLPH